MDHIKFFASQHSIMFTLFFFACSCVLYWLRNGARSWMLGRTTAMGRSAGRGSPLARCQPIGTDKGGRSARLFRVGVAARPPSTTDKTLPPPSAVQKRQGERCIATRRRLFHCGLTAIAEPTGDHQLGAV
jgi:hypothetical protein